MLNTSCILYDDRCLNTLLLDQWARHVDRNLIKPNQNQHNNISHINSIILYSTNQTSIDNYFNYIFLYWLDKNHKIF